MNLVPMPLRRSSAPCLFLASALMVAPPAYGQAAPSAQARADRARVAYDLQDWEAAEAGYRAAYAADQKPAYLWALAQTQRLAGKCTEAIRSYQAFKRAPVKPSQANAAEMMILKCEAEVAKAEVAAAKRGAASPASEDASLAPEPDIYASLGTSGATPTVTSTGPDAGAPDEGLHVGWFIGGAAVTAILGGVTLWSGLDTLSARDDYEAAPTQAGFEDGQSRERRTNGLIGATVGAAVITGLVAVFTDWSPGGDEDGEKRVAHTPTWSVAPDVVGRGAVITGTF
ncbi:MAG: hypothetical protein AAGN82_02480 [Myxococcota bacterium]